MAPFFAWPVLWITLPTLVWLIDGAACADDQHSARWYRRPEAAAAEIGWWFGFGYFVPGLFWIGEAFLVEAETFAVLLPFAVTLLPPVLPRSTPRPRRSPRACAPMAHAAYRRWR
jgi:apolipoprotein N-acyltransferase